MATFGILVGGGPAPGINGVIGAATILARRGQGRVLGFFEGFRTLMDEGPARFRELRISDVSRIHLLGGSILQTSRANPTKDPAALARVVEKLRAQGVDHLITIGGDDTATSARRVSEAAGGSIRVAHVPKTIDNDLPLPQGIPTFGFETARECATRILAQLLEDARTTSRWYLAIVMGRTAGHLALGSAKAAGATVALIPEEFPSGKVPLARVVRLLEGAVVKRLAMARPHGVAVLAEGVAERIDPADMEALENVERDEHGHVRLAEVPFGKIVRDHLRADLGSLGISTTLVPKDVGYELRCAPPNAFDLDYTRDLGAGAVRMLLDGHSGVLITRQGSAIVPIPFDKIIDPATGRTRVRLVDTSTASHATVRALQVRMERRDLDEPDMLERIANAIGKTREEARNRYAELCEPGGT